jgi:16S rRNA (guanine527-N7)-methyltransferase
MNMEIGSTEWRAIIRQGAADLGVSVDDFALQGFETHAKEMLTFNRRINLTTITDPYLIAIKHIVDSLAAAPFVFDQAHLLDIGSGAGFPGVPIKLVRLMPTVTLIDGSARKVSFLKHIIRRLNIEGICAHHQRAENMNRNPDACFDIVISRALAGLEQCIQLAIPLVNMENGLIIALKGHIAESELKALQRLLACRKVRNQPRKNDYDLNVQHFSLPFLGDHRTLVTVHFHG